MQRLYRKVSYISQSSANRQPIIVPIHFSTTSVIVVHSPIQHRPYTASPVYNATFDFVLYENSIYEVGVIVTSISGTQVTVSVSVNNETDTYFELVSRISPVNNLSIIDNHSYVLKQHPKICAKERYNTHAKSCNSILYTKTNSATFFHQGQFSELCVVYNVNSYQTMRF